MTALDRAYALAAKNARPDAPGRAYIYASAYSIREYGHDEYVYRNVAAYHVSLDPTFPLPFIREVTVCHRA